MLVLLRAIADTAPTNMSDRLLRKKVVIDSSPPAWLELQVALKVPKARLANHDGGPLRALGCFHHERNGP